MKASTLVKSSSHQDCDQSATISLHFTESCYHSQISARGSCSTTLGVLCTESFFSLPGVYHMNTPNLPQKQHRYSSSAHGGPGQELPAVILLCNPLSALPHLRTRQVWFPSDTAVLKGHQMTLSQGSYIRYIAY